MRNPSTRSTQGQRRQHAKSVELEVSLQQERDQTRAALSFLWGGRGEREKRRKKRLQRKQIRRHVIAHCPERQHNRKQEQVSSQEMTRDFSVFTQKYIVHFFFFFFFIK